MFTGIIEELGTVEQVESLGDSVILGIRAQKVLSDSKLGDSIAVNGVCLTVARIDDGVFYADCMLETLNRSSLGTLTVGDPVNLERAAAIQSRLGGHIVQGHVDSTTTMLSRQHSEHWDVVRFALPSELARYVVEKGSITVNGTSLTVSALGDDFFEVSLIPTTLQETVLGALQPGDVVNIEVDIVGKYIERMMQLGVNQPGSA